MTSIRVGIAFDVTDKGALPDPDSLGDHLDGVMDALMDLHVSEPDVSASLTNGHVEVTLVLDAPDELAAVQLGVSTLRNAIDAAAGTSRWAVARGSTRISSERVA